MSVEQAAAVAKQQYYRWHARHRPHTDADESLEVWLEAWKMGAWDALRRNAQLGLNLTQIVQRLEEIAALYRDAEFDAEIEAQSAYWHSDVQP